MKINLQFFKSMPRIRLIGIITFFAIIPVILFTIQVLQQNTYTSSHASTQALSLKIVGNKLVNAQGQTIRLFGINRIAGTPCTSHNPSFMDGPFDQTSVNDLTKWHINAVRITMNEDCWLGINKAPAQFSGDNYRNVIINYVNLLNAAGMYVIIDLHINAPGNYLAAGQQAMADKDHALAYWTSVANTFKNNPAVIFEPYNEPHITTSNAKTTNPWYCWLKGCTITEVFLKDGQPPINGSWQAAGMQSLVDTIRNTGATNVITLGGLAYSHDLSKLLQFLPYDKQHQLAATFHNYALSAQGPGGCGPSCWSTVLLPIAKKMPIITDEFGESNCKSNYATEYMNWADQNGISYLPWGWYPWGCATKSNGKVEYGMISDWKGTPNSYGQVFFDHFAKVNSGTQAKTTFSLTVCPHGLGNCGDNVSNSGGNTSPKHTTKNVLLTFLNASNISTATISGTVTYNTSTQNFQGIIPSNANLTGQHLIIIHIDGYLDKQFPGIITVKQGSNVLPDIALVTGDVNVDNKLNIRDYNVLLDCGYGKVNPLPMADPASVFASNACKAHHNAALADLDDNGIIDHNDYSLFIRELSTQLGADYTLQPNPTVTGTTSSKCTPLATYSTACSPLFGAAAAGNPSAPAADRITQFKYLESQVGHQLDVFHDYHAPGSSPLNSAEMYFASRPNTYVYINWKPAANWADAGGGNQTVNTNIANVAKQIKNQKSTFFLTIWHEPENDVSPGTSNCPGLKGIAGTPPKYSPAQYIAMWKNVETIFANEHVTNVVWVMNYTGYNKWDCLVPQLWPGNNLVNWVTWDSYSYNDSSTVDNTIGRFYNVLKTTSDASHDYVHKPWGAAEWGDCLTKDQAHVYNYYNDMKTTLDANKYPNLKLYMVYADSTGPTAGPGCLVDHAASGAYDHQEQLNFNNFANDPIFTQSH